MLMSFFTMEITLLLKVFILIQKQPYVKLMRYLPKVINGKFLSVLNYLFSMADFAVYRVRFKCPDGIQFDFVVPDDRQIMEVRMLCNQFIGTVLPSVFQPCSYDVKREVSDIDPCEDGVFCFSIRAFQALCRSLRTPYLFNSKFYRYALKSKEKRASQA